MNRSRTFAIGLLGAVFLGFLWISGLSAVDMDSALKNADPQKTAAEPAPAASTGTGTGTTTSGGFPMDGTVKVNSKLNVREGPWGKIIGSLGPDAKIKITGVQGEWYKIEYNGKTGFVHKNYVTTAQQTASGIAPTPPGGNNSGTNNGGNNNSGNNNGGNQTITPPSGPGNGRFGGPPARPMARVNSPYGMRTHPIYGDRRMHNGVDVPLPGGTPLLALGDGVVTFASSAGGAGNMIVIRYDNGTESTYMHLQGFNVRQGARVTPGQQVGRVDSTGSSTGNHLHFEMKVNGRRVDPKSVSGIQWS